jgi:hypothetical protein
LVRYFYEQLIVLKELENDKKMYYKISYGLFIHQIDKTNKTIKRLEYEIGKLREFAKSENLEKEQGNNAEIDKFIENLHIEEMKNYHLFTEGVKKFGFEKLATLIETSILQNERGTLKSLEEEKNIFEEKLINDKDSNSLLELNKQKSKIKKVLCGNPNWETRANLVGLKDEHGLIYDFTSALCHFSAYSHQTYFQTNENEYLFYYKILCKTMEQIDHILPILTGRRIIRN